MKLFEVVNGYIGMSYVRLLVIAESEPRAIEIARPIFQKEARGHDERYWTDLEASELCSDTSKEWSAEEVSDE